MKQFISLLLLFILTTSYEAQKMFIDVEFAQIDNTKQFLDKIFKQ